jgi:hypothetical protein
LWSYLKDLVYGTKPATLQELRHEIEQSCTAIPADTLVTICHSCCQQYLDVNSSHIENLW